VVDDCALVQSAATGSEIHPMAGLVLWDFTVVCLEKGDIVQIGADLSGPTGCGSADRFVSELIIVIEFIESMI
jgi:hypothetical protein